MKQSSFKRSAKAMTLIEVLVIIVVVFMMAAMVPWDHRGLRAKAVQVQCLSNLRTLGTALNLFANDHSNNFPWQVSTANSGSLETLSSGNPAPYFLSLSNYLNGNWRTLSCPADISRRLTTDSVLTLNPTNISYFCSVDATPAQPMSIVAGDRNLEVSGLPVKPSLIPITTNTPVAWTREGHGRIMRTPSGCLAFADGHAEVSRTNLSTLLQRQNLPTNRLAVP